MICFFVTLQHIWITWIIINLLLCSVFCVANMFHHFSEFSKSLDLQPSPWNNVCFNTLMALIGCSPAPYKSVPFLCFLFPVLVGFVDPKEIIVKLFTAHCITEAPRLIILDSQGTIVHENARGGASVVLALLRSRFTRCFPDKGW